MRNLIRVCSAVVVALGIAANAAAQPSHPVKIGVLTDLSGYVSDVTGKGSIAAAELAIADFGGKVLGAPIELISADHQNKPDVGTAIARRWYDEEGVDMIVDIPISAIAIGVQAVASEKNKIAMTTSATSDALTNEQCSATGFHWTQDSYSLGKVLGTALAKAGGAKFFFIVIDTTGGKALADSAKPFIEKAGGTVIGVVRHPMEANDFSSFLLQAKASGADYIVFGNGGKDLVNSVTQAHEFHVVPRRQQTRGDSALLKPSARNGPQVRSGSALFHRLLLGPHSGDACVVRALLRQGWKDADRRASGDILGGAALPACSASGGNGRHHEGGRQDP